MVRASLMMAMLGMLGACTHVAGVVERRDGKPVPTAVFSIGRPTDIIMYGTYPVTADGHFDFYISPTDATNLYVYDKGNPEATMRQLQTNEINDHMKLRLDASSLEMDPTLRGLP